MGVHAALSKQREEGVIDADRRHAGEPVGGKVRRQAHIAERWVIVTDAGGMNPVHAEAVRPKCSRGDGPVVLRAAILGVCNVNIAITVVADNGGCGGRVMMPAVTRRDSVFGCEL